MKTDPYRAFIEARKTAHQFRQLQETENLPHARARRGGKNMLNFASNDYLGLSRHPLLIERAQDYAKRYGTGATASRLINGNLPLFAALEERLAHGKGYEAALILNGGYQTNLTVLAALADADVIGKPVTILADRLSHNSLLQGAMLSGAQLNRFHHNDYAHLETLLQRQSDAHTIIVSESVFGMDGDRADLAVLTDLAARYSAMLYIDEAHATGLFGPAGLGLTAGLNGKIDIAMGTFGKALGSFGSYIACSKLLREYLIQRCGGFIYSTALPPQVLGAIDAALELLPQMDKERAHLMHQSTRLRAALQEQGWNCGVSTTHIIPVILGREQAASQLAENLRDNAILTPAIRPPTVPRGTSRLRFSLSAAHSAEDIDHLISVMAAISHSVPQALAS